MMSSYADPTDERYEEEDAQQLDEINDDADTGIEWEEMPDKQCAGCPEIGMLGTREWSRGEWLCEWHYAECEEMRRSENGIGYIGYAE